MTLTKKALSVLLVVSVIISALFLEFSLNVSAETKKGTVTADVLNVRSEPNKTGSVNGKVNSGSTVQINSETIGQTITDGISSNVWYNITYESITGWVSSIYVDIIPEYVYDKDFETQIAKFPESYRPYLRELHAQYPNWKFYPDNINSTFAEAVDMQIPDNAQDPYKNHKVVSNTSKKSWLSMGYGAYDWSTGKWVSKDTDWYVASREVVRHYMDPRNYLNTSVIYAFLPQIYNSATQNEAGINAIIKDTFLEKGYSDSKDTAYGGSYTKVLMAAAQASNVSPYILAGIIIQEQGTAGTSFMISGEYSGYKGYYNFFNINTYGSSDSEKAKSGLGYAKDNGWNTRSKSIIGGASFCANNYLGVGQDTYYYMNFNVKQPERLWHQYATNIADTYGKAQKLSKSYANLKEAELDFTIPVFKDMPTNTCALPAKSNKLNNYYITDISATGLTPSFYRYNYSYDLSVTSDTVIGVSIPSSASFASATSFNLKKGNNTVVLKVKSQTGYSNSYTINVNAAKACKLYIDGVTANSTVNLGDIDGDKKITINDIGRIKQHLLKKYTIKEENLTVADIDKDGKITINDIGRIKQHLLGKYLIK